jgi:hypothetical protein
MTVFYPVSVPVTTPVFEPVIDDTFPDGYVQWVDNYGEPMRDNLGNILYFNNPED